MAGEAAPAPGAGRARGARDSPGNQTRSSGATAREIAEGTGLALSTVYRALHELQDRGLLFRTPPVCGGCGK